MNDWRGVAFGACFLAFAASSACSSSDSSTSSSSSGTSGTSATRSGVTACGAQSCQAGQYCLNLLCTPGCGSDDNCASNQTCQKTNGQNVGSCQAAATPPAGKDCSGYVKKCTACGESSSNCTASCDVITAECISCVVNTSGCTLDACKSVCGVK